jgi:hypothetical protein
MAEQEARIESDVLADALHLAATGPRGFRLRLHPDEEMRLVLAGSGGEVTLFIAPKAQDEPTSPPPPAMPAPQETIPATDVEKRVKLRGRVGSAPQYKPLPRRGLRVGFRFAAFTDSEKPDWHEVYATGKFAEAIQAKAIAKGDEVDLTGERQLGIQRQRDGSERTVERIFAYGVSLKKRAQRPL